MRHLASLAAVAALLVVVGCGSDDGGGSNASGCDGLGGRDGVSFEYLAEPLKEAGVDQANLDDTASILCKRLKAAGAADSDVRIDGERIKVTVPKDSALAKQGAAAVGSSGRVYMYDFAQNVVPESSAETSADAEQSLPYKTLYSAVKGASRLPPNVYDKSSTSCGGSSRPKDCKQYYLFDAQKKLVAGPAGSKQALTQAAGGSISADQKIVTVPTGIVVVENKPPNGLPSSTRLGPSYFVLRDNPAIDGAATKDPRATVDTGGGGGPAVSFMFTADGANQFQTVTRTLAHRALTDQRVGEAPVPQTFATVLDRKIVSRASIDPQQYPDGIDGKTGAEVSGLTAAEAKQLAAVLKNEPLPLTLVPLS